MKILIATDGSEFSEAAIKEVTRLFPDLSGAEVKIVSVFEEQYVLAPEPVAVSAQYYQQMSEAAAKHAEIFCEKAERLFRDCTFEMDVTVDAEVLKGIPEQQITEFAREWDADLIVVGSHGRGFWGRMIGSVSDAVVHHAPCSVLVVRPAVRDR